MVPPTDNPTVDHVLLAPLRVSAPETVVKPEHTTFVESVIVPAIEDVVALRLYDPVIVEPVATVTKPLLVHTPPPIVYVAVVVGARFNG
jgi:hypothetical protein